MQGGYVDLTQGQDSRGSYLDEPAAKRIKQEPNLGIPMGLPAGMIPPQLAGMQLPPGMHIVTDSHSPAVSQIRRFHFRPKNIFTLFQATSKTACKSESPSTPNGRDPFVKFQFLSSDRASQSP